MLDRDLAELYGVKPIRLREQVKRNSNRFPEDFMFQISEDEVDYMVSQNAIPSRKHLGGTLPYVFTEQGVAGISGVLTSNRAIEINIAIMRAFAKMRQFLANNADLFMRLESTPLSTKEEKGGIMKVSTTPTYSPLSISIFPPEASISDVSRQEEMAYL